MKKLAIAIIFLHHLIAAAAANTTLPAYEKQAQINAHKARMLQHQTATPITLMHNAKRHHVWEIGVAVTSAAESGRRITKLTYTLGTTLTKQELEGARKANPYFNDQLYTLSPFLKTLLKNGDLPDESDEFTSNVILMDQQNEVLDTIELNMKDNNDLYEAVESSYKGTTTQ
jgi:hypothetical protein